jgi:taurine--2-oxoglutarate transaminase
MENQIWRDRSPEEVAKLSHDHTFFNWAVQGTTPPRAVITGGKGCYFWDTEGKRYLDFSSQFISVNAGHNHPKIKQAICEQVENLCYISPPFTTHARAEFGRLLVEVTPKRLTKVFASLSGSDANENALKIAKLFMGRHKIISTYRSYHGSLHGCGVITGDSRRWAVEPALPGVCHVPAPYCYRCDFGLEPSTCDIKCAKYIGQVIEYEGPKNVAAFMVEGVNGSNGVLFPHRNDYMTTVRHICDQTGILLIVDEVMSGFGRTGEWFAVDNWNVQPDIMTMAKGLTSSHIPMGAVAVRREIADYFEDNLFWLGTTYAHHPISCAAAIAAINVYKEEKLIENSKEQGKFLSEYLLGMKGRHPSIGDVRGLGLFQFIELVKNRKTKESFAPSTQTISPWADIKDVDAELLKRGVHTMAHPLGIFIAPPLCITRDELLEGLSIVDEVLSITTDKRCVLD